MVIMALTCIILETKRDIGRKSRFFHTTLAFDAPVRGSPLEYCYTIWYRKTGMVGLPGGEKKFEDMFSGVDRLLVCDGRTDRRTDILRRHSPRYAYASRGKTNILFHFLEELLENLTNLNENFGQYSYKGVLILKLKINCLVAEYSLPTAA